MTDEWGPWKDHDGKGCPCVGKWVQIELDQDAECCPSDWAQLSPRMFEGHVSEELAEGAEWYWEWGPRAIRYRIRKPRALLDLIKMLKNLPEEVDA